MIQKQESIPQVDVEKYTGLLNFYRHSKEFPKTFTSLVFNQLLMNSQYDTPVTVPILREIVFNDPLIALLKIDVFTPHFLDSLISDPES